MPRRARRSVTREDPRQVGGRYLCGYWRHEYIVRAVEDRNGVTWITAEWQPTTAESHPLASQQWADDPVHVTVHCTRWDDRSDIVIAQPDFIALKQWLADNF